MQSSNINGLSEDFVSLQKLSIVNCGLSSLEGLPKLLSLEKVLYPPTHTHPHTLHTLTAATQ